MTLKLQTHRRSVYMAESILVLFFIGLKEMTTLIQYKIQLSHIKALHSATMQIGNTLKLIDCDSRNALKLWKVLCQFFGAEIAVTFSSEILPQIARLRILRNL